mgnify:CR=1 FL=1
MKDSEAKIIAYSPHVYARAYNVVQKNKFGLGKENRSVVRFYPKIFKKGAKIIQIKDKQSELTCQSVLQTIPTGKMC